MYYCYKWPRTYLALKQRHHQQARAVLIVQKTEEHYHNPGRWCLGRERSELMEEIEGPLTEQIMWRIAVKLQFSDAFSLISYGKIMV